MQFRNRYGLYTLWRTYTLCRVYCSLGFESAEGTPRDNYWVTYRCRRDGNGELFINQTGLNCKEQKCETFGSEFSTYSRSANLIENNVVIRNETIRHMTKGLLFGDYPCCANANASMPVFDFIGASGACMPLVKTCIPTVTSSDPPK